MLRVVFVWPTGRLSVLRSKNINAGHYMKIVQPKNNYLSSSKLWTYENTDNEMHGDKKGFVCLLVGCLTSQQQASVSQGRICSDNFTCCHTEIEVADQTFYLTQSQYTDTGPTSPSADPMTPVAWQGSHWSANFLSHWYDSTRRQGGKEGGKVFCVP